jgi:hypothetical protein
MGISRFEKNQVQKLWGDKIGILFIVKDFKDESGSLLQSFKVLLFSKIS